MMKRIEIPGQPVKKTIRHTRNGSTPFINYIWDGLHTVIDQEGKQYMADRSIIHDGGKLGSAFTFIGHREYTSEERAAIRENLDRVIRQICPGMALAE